jgi:hypothetical protein
MLPVSDHFLTTVDRCGQFSAPLSANQLRRYAWSAKLPVSILTDFRSRAARVSLRKAIHPFLD